MSAMDIELPNGQVLAGVPMGTSKIQVMQAAVKNGLAQWEDFGLAEDPTFLGGKPLASPTEGGSNVLAGAGKAFVDLGRGVRQLFNDSPQLQAEIDAAKKRDAPLMSTGAGMAGNALGAVGMAVPLMAIPGVNTVAGSAALGGVAGFLQPVASDETRLAKTGYGTILGGAGQALGNMLPRAVQAVAAPFYESGRNRIVANVLRRFQTDPNAIGRAATENVPGVQYTLAEATQDPGLAILEKAAGAADPNVAAAIKARDVQNVLAARNAVGDIAGDQAQRDAAIAAREASSGAAYQTARAAVVPADAELVRLMQRPEIAAAFRQARENAANSGQQVAANIYTPAARVTNGLEGFRDVPEQFGDVSGDLLHQVKMALDASLASGPQRGIVGANANAVRSARDDLLNWIEQRIPEYADGRIAYAAGSRPVNQMEIGQRLYDSLAPALTDAQGVTLARSTPQKFATALRNGDATAVSATGFPAATMEGVMEPGQMQTINAVRDYFARRAAAGELSAARGSDTAQNLAGLNVLRSIAGPLGLPEGFLASTLAQTVSRPLSVLAQPAEAAIQRRLAEALLNPQMASGIIQSTTPTARQALLQNLYSRALTAGSVGAGTASQ